MTTVFIITISILSSLLGFSVYRLVKLDNQLKTEKTRGDIGWKQFHEISDILDRKNSEISNLKKELSYRQKRKKVRTRKMNEDVVSREHLLSGIDELMQSPWFNNGKDFYDGTFRHYGYVERKEAVEVVRDLCINTCPPVTPERKKGKWEEFYDLDHGMGIIFLKCPFCGEFQSKADNHNFCPNCGAKLEVSK